MTRVYLTYFIRRKLLNAIRTEVIFTIFHQYYYNLLITIHKGPLLELIITFVLLLSQ